MLQWGWALTDAIDTSRREKGEKSMLLFRRCVPTTASFSCICLTSTGNLRLINFSPREKKVLRSCILENYLPCASVRNTSEGNSLKFTLTGNPWSSHGAGLHARSLLVHLFVAAIDLGFQIVASADVSSEYKKNEDTDEEKTDHPLDAHSIYLVKMPKQQNQGRLLESFQKREKQFTLASLASFQIHEAVKARVPSTLASRSPLRM